MIKMMRVRNFKAFEDTGDIVIKPITVLAGPNSGGKTSILQSLLLLKQTLEPATPGVDLNLEGRFLHFPKFRELVFGKPPLRECELGYSFTVEGRIPPDAVAEYFPHLTVPQGSGWLPLESDIQLSFRYRKTSTGQRRVALHCLSMDSTLEGMRGSQLSVVARGTRLEADLHGIDLSEPYRDKRVRNVLLRGFIPAALIMEPDPERKEVGLVGLPPVFLNPLLDLVNEIEENLAYLGPLREEPRTAYLHSGSPLPEIGKRGENAAQLLWLERGKPVEYLPALGEEPRRLTLQKAVGEAFYRLGITRRPDVRSARGIVYQILFGIKDAKGVSRQVTIADVGFGVSQLLPIVVLGLLSPKLSLLLLEQPEIHLHPRLQANLADFLLTLALSGRRLLVETHSDHLINRLRRRIAEDPSDELRDKVSILFVRPPENGQGATIEPLRVDRYGVIENWPPEFLPESADEAEAIFRAGLQKRKAE